MRLEGEVRRMLTTMAVAALMLGAASPAMGSGKAAGGGATGGGGGGGGNRGGVNGGGANDPVASPPAPAPASAADPSTPACATFQSATAPVGYYLTYAAVWNDYTIRDCSGRTENVNVEVIDADCSTGRVDYDVVYPNLIGAGQNFAAVLDNDFAPFDTSYCITYTARDALTGAQLDQATLTATTPAPR